MHRLSPTASSPPRSSWPQWRENEAKTKNRPLRRLLRDDLIIELARRQPRTLADIAATRDINRGDYRRHYDDFLAALDRARALPKDQLPTPPEPDRPDTKPDEHILGQLLGIALSSRCAEQGRGPAARGAPAPTCGTSSAGTCTARRGRLPSSPAVGGPKLCGDPADRRDGRQNRHARRRPQTATPPLVFERNDGNARKV